MSNKYRNQQSGIDPFDRTPEAADKAIFGTGATEAFPETRIVATPTDVMKIWADVKQPRRAVPASIRMHWNGNPDDVAELLNRWYMVAKSRAGVEIDILEILNGRGEGLEVDQKPAIYQEYIELLWLAQSIHKDGLLHPISIISQAGRNLIESGERRWLAYHVLKTWVGDAYAKIPAIKTDGVDYVWRQAAENTARRQLNAISMARQLALLIMASRDHLDGQTYDDFDQMVNQGGCDRRYYAQVANGQVHRVPKGMGERIQSAMGLSMHQLSRYRNLLRLTEDEAINDALWIQADTENGAEGTLRYIVDRLPIGNLRQIVLKSSDWTLEDLRNLADTLPFGKVSPSDGPGTAQNTAQGQTSTLPQTNSSTPLQRPPEVGSGSSVGTAGTGFNEEYTYDPNEAVEVLATGEVGEVIQHWRGVVKVNVDGEIMEYAPDKLMSYGMTYLDFIREEFARDDVSFDEPDEDISTDNLLSDTPSRTLIFPHGDTLRELLLHFKMLAKTAHDMKSEQLFNKLLDYTVEKADEERCAEQLAGLLDQFYDQGQVFFEEHFTAILTKIDVSGFDE
ncbi:MAG: ParB N-terminal domain-containing protein [Anaerolineae bacterium]|nr:ParB N-terminal domain-containing protein [Anaerolineae bacterium]